MSLINDALKRASQSDPAKMPAMEVLLPVPSPAPSRLPLVVLPFVLVAALGLGVWFLVRGWEATRQAAQITVAARSVAHQFPPETAVTTPPISEVSLAISTKAIVDPSASSASELIQTPAVPVVEEAPTFPKLRLQAVFYRKTMPSVVMNNTLLRVGEKVADATVIAITRQGALVEWGGERREFILP